MKTSCQICGREFSRGWNRDRHLQSMHGLDLSTDFTLEIRNNKYPFNSYSKGNRDISTKFEYPSYHFDPNWFPYRDLDRNNDLFKNREDNFFYPYQNPFAHQTYESEDDLYSNNFPRLCIKIRARIDLFRNSLLSRNPYLAYTPMSRKYIDDTNTLVLFLTYRCLSEKSTQLVDRWLGKLGY